MADKVYHPQNSLANDDQLLGFVQAQLTGDLGKDLLGVGPATVTALNNEGITTTFQLIAKYLSFKGIEDGEMVDPKLHSQMFYQWLCEVNTAGKYRSTVVHCIAEKMNIVFPGLYEAEAYN
jgi:hypothetical protein